MYDFLIRLSPSVFHPWSIHRRVGVLLPSRHFRRNRSCREDRAQSATRFLQCPKSEKIELQIVSISSQLFYFSTDYENTITFSIEFQIYVCLQSKRPILKAPCVTYEL